jgi:predicted aspartyl protease
MPNAVKLAQESVEVKLRRPSTVAVLTIVTLGVYSIFWYHRVNREMRDFGSRSGDRRLAASNPWRSVLAVTIGGIVVIPRLFSFWRAGKRVQAVELIATGAARSRSGLTMSLAGAGVLPLGGSIHRFGPLLSLAGFACWVAATSRIQARLNAAWQANGAIVAPSSDLAGGDSLTTPSRSIVAASLVVGAVLITLTRATAASADRPHVASSVPLVVVKAKDGEVAALAKVVIHGRPVPFVIDTGATVTVVNVELARQLGLKPVGRPIRVSGVGCSSSSRRVGLSHWTIGSQPLPAITAVSVNIPFSHGRPFGLLGSDVLARFGSITIDYQHAALTLG